MFLLGEEPLHVVVVFRCFFCSYPCFVHARMMENNGMTVTTTAAASSMTPSAHKSSQAVVISITKAKKNLIFNPIFVDASL